jgi:hypothetical protein
MARYKLSEEPAMTPVPVVELRDYLAHVRELGAELTMMVEGRLSADGAFGRRFAGSGLLEKETLSRSVEDLEVLVSPPRIDDLEITRNNRGRAHVVEIDQVRDDCIDRQILGQTSRDHT